ncbi:MAG: DUF3108 domain-containing protein [Candidatus Marinimicrobia bacterium]|nr:DUF3108 domain-containing protein [Candidatus Neomarinimicrobiota bacterium]
MIKKIQILIFILFALLFLNSILLSETYNYKIYFKGIKGGKAKLTINKNNNNVTAKFLLKTTGLVDKFYKIRDTITVIASYPNYHTIKLDRKINEGKYHKHIIFDVSKIDTSSLSSPIRDEYTAMIMLMDSIYVNSYKVRLNLFKESKEISYEFIKTKNKRILFNGKQVLCNFYEPTHKSSSKLKKKGGMGLSIWMSKTIPMKPIIIEFDLKYGSLHLELTK